MRTAIAALIVAATFTVAGCDHELCHGQVTGKDHQDGYTTTTLMPVGKTLIPETNYVPPVWELHLRDHGDETGDCEVDEDTYNRVEVGGSYP